MRVPGHGVDLAADGHCIARVRGEVAGIDAGFFQGVTELLDIAGVVAQLSRMHHRDRRNVLGGDARIQLLIVWAPLDDLRLHHDVVLVRGVEQIHQRRHHAALPARVLDILRGAVVALTGTKEAGKGNLGFLLRGRRGGGQ